MVLITSRPALAAAVAVALIAGGVAGTLARSPVAPGKELAERLCARCHSIDGTSASKHDKAPPFRTLGVRYPVRQLAEALAEGIVTGHPDMPQFTLTPNEIDELLSFMEGLQTARK